MLFGTSEWLAAAVVAAAQRSIHFPVPMDLAVAVPPSPTAVIRI